MAIQISISNAIGSRDIVGSSVDPDAQAFITAAGITDPTQQSAINTLVVDLKGYSIWTKMDAIYPMVGGSSSSHKFNLKNPLDTDAAFRLVFSGGWTHSSTGATPNGTNAYADTFLNDNTVNTLNNVHISVYSRTNTTTQSADISSYDGTNLTSIFPYLANAIYAMAHQTTVSAVTPFVNSLGLFISNRTNSTQLFTFKNTTKYTSAFNSVAKSNQNFTLSRTSATVGNYSDRQLAFASIGSGLTDTEAANFYTAVQAFQTTLGRSIGTQVVSDADAQAFVTAANIVDQVEADAVNNLVIGLKADNLWNSMKAIYPFVGGVASSNKFNLKDPRDLDAAFRLVFNGGWTHASTGATPNGTNGYADTKLLSQGTLGLNSTSFGVYSRTNVNRNAPSIGNVTGGASAECSLWLSTGGNAALRVNNPNVSIQASTDSRGLFIANRVNSTQINLQIRGTQYTFSQNSNTLYTNPFQLGGVNPNFFDTKELAFAFIGDGLTSQNMTDMNTRVIAFETELNRNV